MEQRKNAPEGSSFHAEPSTWAGSSPNAQTSSNLPAQASSSAATHPTRKPQAYVFAAPKTYGKAGARTICGMPRSKFVAQTGMTAALYAAATLAALMLLQGLAWGPVQFRVSEALCVTAALTPAAVPGLALGCAIANLIALALNGTGALGMLDVVFGSAATLAGALWCWKLREHPKAALLGPVLANALVVPAYLPLILQGMGYYAIPFTTVSIEGAYLPMYLFGLAATGIGEGLVMYALGLPLLKQLKKLGAGK